MMHRVRRSLRIRLMLLAAVAALLPALLLGGVGYLSQRRSLESSYGYLLRLAAEQSAANVEGWLADRVESAQRIARNPVVQEQSRVLAGLSPKSDEYFVRLFLLHDVLNASRDPWESEIRLWDARTGRVIYSTNSYAIGGPWCGLAALAREDADRWKEGTILRTPLYSSTISLLDPQGKIAIGLPTFQIAVAVGGRPDAKMAVAMRPDLFRMGRLLVRGVSASPSARVPLNVCIVTASGRFVTSPRQSETDSTPGVPPWYLSPTLRSVDPATGLPTAPVAEFRHANGRVDAGGHLVDGAYVNQRGETVHGAWAPVPGTDWVVVAEIDRASMLEPLRESLLGVVGIAIGVGLLVAVMAALVSTRFLRPLQQLTSATDLLAGGDRTVRCGLRGEDEIGRLGQAFDVMAASIEATLAQLESMRDQALSASRAKSTFLANMSHELRTPLNAIVGYTDLLVERCKEDGHVGYLDALDRISRSAAYLTEIIGNVLDMSKIEAGKMTLHQEDFVTRQVVDEVRHTVEPLAAVQGNQFEVRVDPACATMNGDRVKLRQILINLLSNAFKFTRDGRVSLEVTEEKGGDEAWTVFRVVDSGIGMTAAQMEHLFEPFTQVSQDSTRRYGGTGLGLSISKRFAEMMGGTLEVSSEMDKGSTFTLRLPVQGKSGQPADEASRGEA